MNSSMNERMRPQNFGKTHYWSRALLERLEEKLKKDMDRKHERRQMYKSPLNSSDVKRK